MRRLLIGGLLIGTLAWLVGCGTTNSQILSSNQKNALQTALDRATFDTRCVNPTGSIISSEVIAPPVGGGQWVGNGREAKYVVHVTGCGKTNDFTVLCTADGAGCTAADINPNAAP